MSGEVFTFPHCGRRNRVPAAAAGIPRCGQCHRPLPWITDATDESSADIAEAADLPVLVDLWAWGHGGDPGMTLGPRPGRPGGAP